MKNLGHDTFTPYVGGFYLTSSAPSSSFNPFASGGGYSSGGTTFYPMSSMSVPTNSFLMDSHPSSLSVPLGGNVSFGMSLP